MKKDNLLLIFTVLVIFSVIYAAVFFDNKCPQKIDVQNQPTFGSSQASVQIVVFEDFQSKQDMEHLNIFFAKIKKSYIDTGKVRYVVIPIAKDSRDLANAVLGIYDIGINKFDFFSYLQKITGCEQINKEHILEAAKNFQDIDVKQLEKLILSNHYDIQLNKNLQIAQKIMTKNNKQPAIYINGRRARDYSFEQIISQIDEELVFKGK